MAVSKCMKDYCGWCCIVFGDADTLTCKMECAKETVRGELDPSVVSKCLSDSSVYSDPSVAVTACDSCVHSSKNE